MFDPITICALAVATTPVAAAATTSLDHAVAFVAPLATQPLPVAPPLNHGPGTSGGGGQTSAGETLRKGHWSFELRSDWVEFEHVSVDAAEAKALDADEFDALESSWVNRLDVGYGLSDDVQLGVQVGYYSGTDFIEAESDGMGGAESASADPHGLTDAWLSAKWRVHARAGQALALLGGIKLPTGKDDAKLSSGETLEPSSQPGSGSVDYQLGLAYSRELSARWSLDASALYTLRTEHDDFEVGDRADLGVALAYRCGDLARATQRWSVFGELNGVWLGKDDDDGETNDNSGGSALYLGLGVRDRIDAHWAISVAPSFPIAQDVNGEQVETDWRVGLALTYTP